MRTEWRNANPSEVILWSRWNPLNEQIHKWRKATENQLLDFRFLGYIYIRRNPLSSLLHDFGPCIRPVS